MIAHNLINPEELLRILYQSPNATAIYSGEDITILSVNQAMLNLWGKDRSVVGLSFEKAIPELLDQPFFKILQTVWRTGETYFAKDMSADLDVDGKVQSFYFDFEYKAILDENGKTKYILHTAFEVSARMAAWKIVEEKSKAEQNFNEELSAINEELQTSNEELTESQLILSKMYDTLNISQKRFKTMIEQSPVAMASLKGEDFTIDAANDMILNIWGKDKSVIGLPLHTALPEIKDQPFLNILKEVFKTETPFHGEEIRATLSVNGELMDRYLNFVYEPTKDKIGEEKSILIVANDVTDQVTARKKVEELNTRLEIALDASSLGSTEVELATGIMQSTDQFKKNYGFAPDEDFAYADLFNAMFPEYREAVKQMVQEAIRTNGVYKTEYPVKWRDGSIHWIQAHGRPRYDENGNADRMVGMTADITEKKLFEQRKDDFLSVTSHELRTPLTVLKASIQLLERIKEKPFGEMHLKLIDQSLKSVDHMTEMVNEILNVRRLSEGQLQVEKKWFNLFEMLSHSCNHLKIDNEYQLIVKGDKHIDVFADENRIDQVVINFVNNAVKYAPSSKDILLTIDSVPGYVKVSVRDYGKGIQPEELPKLFDRYYRSDHSGKGYSGLGLGLYICSEIIKKHNGEIGAESTLDEGSTFWFTLPTQKK